MIPFKSWAFSQRTCSSTEAILAALLPDAMVMKHLPPARQRVVVHSSTERLHVSNFACRAFVFDLDGVLADSTEAVNRAWEAWATRNAIDPQLAIRNGHGRTTIEAIRVTAPHVDAHASFAQMEALEESFVETVKPV